MLLLLLGRAIGIDEELCIFIVDLLQAHPQSLHGSFDGVARESGFHHLPARLRSGRCLRQTSRQGDTRPLDNFELTFQIGADLPAKPCRKRHIARCLERCRHLDTTGRSSGHQRLGLLGGQDELSGVRLERSKRLDSPDNRHDFTGCRSGTHDRVDVAGELVDQLDNLVCALVRAICLTDVDAPSVGQPSHGILDGRRHSSSQFLVLFDCLAQAFIQICDRQGPGDAQIAHLRSRLAR